jgi:hypothetical protein
LRVAAQRDAPSSLANRVAGQLDQFPIATTIMLAERDGTAVAFKAQWEGTFFENYRPDIPVITLDSGSHSFANEADYTALVSVLTKALSA